MRKFSSKTNLKIGDSSLQAAVLLFQLIMSRL